MIRQLGALPRATAAHGSRISVSQQRSLYRGSTAYATDPSSSIPGMTIRSFPACFVRGGTSNGLVIHRKDLPKDVEDWQPILSAAMGSPDGFGRQLDGMGSGVSSTSKVCVVGRSNRVDADLDFTFVQVDIKDGSLDLAGNCGNMSSVIGPFAFSEGLLHNVYENGKAEEHKEATARIFNTNTGKLINATFSVTKDGVYNPLGGYSIDGVPGSGSRITLAFLDPAGAKTGIALPTGNAVDNVKLPNGSSIRASLVDVANPGVFVLAEDIGAPGDVKPATLEGNIEIMSKLEHIRQEGARMMGMEPAQTVPKIVMVSRPNSSEIDEGVHIVCRALSMQQPHKAVPLTLALNLGASCRMPGTLPADVAVGDPNERESLTIAHASGKVDVGSIFEGGKIKSAQLHRTARIMMKGDVFYTAKTRWMSGAVETQRRFQSLIAKMSQEEIYVIICNTVQQPSIAARKRCGSVLRAMSCVCKTLISPGRESCCTTRPRQKATAEASSSSAGHSSRASDKNEKACSSDVEIGKPCCDKRKSGSKADDLECKDISVDSAGSCCYDLEAKEKSCRDAGTTSPTFTGCRSSKPRPTSGDIELGFGGLEHIVLSVQGMTCTGCEMDLARPIATVPSAINSKPSIVLSRVEFDVDPSVISSENAISQLATGTGFVMSKIQQSGHVLQIVAADFVRAVTYNLFAILLAAEAFVGARIPPSHAGRGEVVSVLPVAAVALQMK
ncbi:hypothetical protein AC579_5317 [Pseudocercospora musae]|uniref:Uncharacterized protein n=1 Tax=Pseudocercospora musae TaxID=113226 RepID=A0A139ISZ3_9PEZI|nr:hypothetical protein AC579_5317 [Pseudocercospora musae]